MTRFAAETTVPVEKSRAEIEAVLGRYGADEFAYMANQREAAIAFKAHGRMVRFHLPLPDKASTEFTKKPSRSSWGEPTDRTPEDVHKRWEQACRQRWRALGLVVKAKLEAVACGISEFEDEFLAYIVVPGTDQTVGAMVRPKLAESYATGASVALLPGPGVR